MGLFTWWKHDTLPQLEPLSSFGAERTIDVHLVAGLAGLTADTVQERLEQGHAVYVARLGATPVAYGWVARERASIGELPLTFVIGSEDRYLWDFATLPSWRGRGIYPRLLQAILHQEQGERFWIIHAPENAPSARGIVKAGFHLVGALSFLKDGRPGLAPRGEPARAVMGAGLLGLPLIRQSGKDALNPCWRCVIDSRAHAARTVPLLLQQTVHVHACRTPCACVVPAPGVQ